MNAVRVYDFNHIVNLRTRDEVLRDFKSLLA